MYCNIDDIINVSIIAASQKALSTCITFGDYVTVVCCNKITGINAAPQEAFSK